MLKFCFCLCWCIIGLLEIISHPIKVHQTTMKLDMRRGLKLYYAFYLFLFYRIISSFVHNLLTFSLELEYLLLIFFQVLTITFFCQLFQLSTYNLNVGSFSYIRWNCYHALCFHICVLASLLVAKCWDKYSEINWFVWTHDVVDEKIFAQKIHLPTPSFPVGPDKQKWIAR